MGGRLNLLITDEEASVAMSNLAQVGIAIRDQLDNWSGLRTWLLRQPEGSGSEEMIRVIDKLFETWSALDVAIRFKPVRPMETDA